MKHTLLLFFFSNSMADREFHNYLNQFTSKNFTHDATALAIIITQSNCTTYVLYTYLA